MWARLIGYYDPAGRDAEHFYFWSVNEREIGVSTKYDYLTMQHFSVGDEVKVEVAYD